MADRKLTWDVVVNFSKARKEARDLQRDLDRVRESEARLGKQGRDTAKSTDQSAQAQREAADAARDRTSETQKATQATQADTAASDAHARSMGNEAQQGTGLLGVLKRVTQARRENGAAAQQAAAAVEQASRREQAAERAKIATLNEVKAARRDYNRVVRESGATSAAAATAENRLITAQTRHKEASNSARIATVALNRAMSDNSRVNEAAGRAMARASGEGSRLTRVLVRLGGAFQGVKAGAMIVGIGGLIAMLPGLIGLISNLGAGLVALASSVSVAAGALGALPGIFATVAGAVGVLVGALGGVGGALKAYGQQQAKTTKQTNSSARAIKNAQRGIAQARRQAAESARQSARAIADAERQIEDAQRSAERAQRAVTEARKAARRELEGLKASLEGIAQSEEGAAIALEEAKIRLQQTMIDPGATDLERRSASLAVREAMTRLSEVRREGDNLREDAAEATRRGVEGSEQVVAAKEAEADAVRAVQDAYRNHAEAQRQAKIQARESAEAIRAAKEALAGAKESAAAAAGGVNQYAEAMKKLTPAQREFVRLLISLKPELDKLKRAASAGLLPGLGAALLEMSKLTNLVADGLFRTGRAMGDAALNTAKYLTATKATDKAARRLTEAERKQFGTRAMLSRITDSSVKNTESAGRTTTFLTRALVNLTDAARPLTEWLFEVVEGWARYLAVTAEANNRNGDMAAGFERVRWVMSTLGKIISNLFWTFINIGKASSESGDSMLTSIERVTAGWKRWTGSIEGENKLAKWFDNGRIALGHLMNAIGKIGKGIFNFGLGPEGPEMARQINEELVPALGRIMNALKDADVGSEFVDMLTAVSNAVADLIEVAGPPFLLVVEILTGLANALSWILRQGAVGETLGKIAGGLLAVGIAGKVLGFFGGMLLSIGRGVLLFGSVLLRIATFVVPMVVKALLFLGRAMLMNPWGLLITALIIVVVLIIKYWDQIKSAVLKAINWVIGFVKKNWAKILPILLGPLGLAIVAIIKNWDRIKGAFRAAVGFIGKWLGKGWDLIKWLVKPFEPVLTFFKKAWDKIADLFRGGVRLAGRIAEGIGNVMRNPARTFQRIVNWLIDKVNWVIDKLGGPKRTISPWGGSPPGGGGGGTSANPTHRARGGYVPGQGNRDSEHAILMPGEYVLRKDAVRKIGVQNLEALNEGRKRRGRKPYHFNSGGEVTGGMVGGEGAAEAPAEGGVLGSAWDKVKGAATGAKDLFTDGAQAVLKWALGPLEGKIRGAMSGAGGQLLMGLGRKLIAPAMALVKKKEEQFGGSLSSGIISPTGGRHSGVWGRYASGGYHPALDYPAPSGRRVRASLSGRVAAVRHMRTSYGNHVVLSHGAGVTSLYGHMSRTASRQGTAKPKGTTIGYVGSTGNSTGPHVHLEFRRNGRAFNFTKYLKYAQGGAVARRKSGVVPAMLTPGEFVLNRKAAKKIGKRRLRQLNRGTGKGNAGKYGYSGPIGFHKGGEVPGVPYSPVLGMKKGANAAWVRYLRHLAGITTKTSLWDDELDARLNAYNLGTGTLSTADYNFTQPQIMAYANWLRGSKKGRTPAEALKLPYIAGSEPKLYKLHWQLYFDPKNSPAYKRTTSAQRAKIKTWYSAYRAKRDGDLNALNALLGTTLTTEGEDSTAKPKFTAEGRAALQHALSHSFGRAHDTFASRPWQPFTGVEAYVQQTEQRNAQTREFNGYLQTLSNWGLSDLVKDLIAKGVEEGLSIASSAVNDRDMAERLNVAVRESAALAGEDLTSVFGLISLFTNGSAGLRDAARAIGQSDLTTVTLFEKLLNSGQLSNVPSGNLDEMLEDILKYRMGTFYANRGGAVPGYGNTDKVPAMLTPGEFVIRKKAAQALGLANLQAMNGLKGYAEGGLVEAFSGFGPLPFARGGLVPARVPASALERAQGRTTQVVYKTTINNPVAEKSTKSLTKMLQRRAVVNGATEFKEAPDA